MYKINNLLQIIKTTHCSLLCRKDSQSLLWESGHWLPTIKAILEGDWRSNADWRSDLIMLHSSRAGSHTHLAKNIVLLHSEKWLLLQDQKLIFIVTIDRFALLFHAPGDTVHDSSYHLNDKKYCFPVIFHQNYFCPLLKPHLILAVTLHQ